MSKERDNHFQLAKDVYSETDKDLKKHIVPSPPEKMKLANERLSALLEKNKETAPEQDHTE